MYEKYVTKICWQINVDLEVTFVYLLKSDLPRDIFENISK